MRWKTKQAVDFEQLGLETMRQIKNFEATEQICGLRIHAYSDELQPEIESLTTGMCEKRAGATALRSHVYDREEPVSDAAMLAHEIGIWVVGILFVVVSAAALAAHTGRLYLFGFGLFAAFGLGLLLTGAAVGAGHLAFEKIFSGSKALQMLIAAAGAFLVLWGLLQLAQAGAVLVDKGDSSDKATQSYVDDAPAEPTATDPTMQSREQQVKSTLSGALTRLFLGADLMIGILLGTFVALRTNEDYAAWRKLKLLSKEIAQMELKRNYLASLIEIAKKKCMAGILRAMHTPKKKHVPYFQALPIIMLVIVLITVPASAQDVSRQEGILIDISGSISSGGSNNDLFRDYQLGVKHLLETEPTNSRAVVSVITTESFGSVREVLKGRTPEAHGIFTDELNRARRQLAASFTTKSSTMTPIAAGTDIVGALWHMKALLESENADGTAIEREIWIFSDMMNETASLPMPALLATGPENMMEHAKRNGLVVPLNGYRIHVIGASTRGLTPQAWNIVKGFWSAYFLAAGAELVSYSAEDSIVR